MKIVVKGWPECYWWEVVDGENSLVINRNYTRKSDAKRGARRFQKRAGMFIYLCEVVDDSQ